jgi:glycosyltransferase involved in cell wall biosynthesis
MSDLPRITVVTPSFNQAAYIAGTLKSVLDQGYPNLEYIVMDGGSTDGSVDLIRQHADRLAYWVSRPDEGQADAILQGLSRATGEVATWLNSDDILMPGALHLVGSVLAAYPEIQWLTGWPTNIDERGEVVRRGLPPGYYRSLIRAGWYHGRGLGFIRQEGTFWRRDLWIRSGAMLDCRRYYSMDAELWRRFAAHAPLVAVRSSLAAFRNQPQRKSADIAAYYHEAGIRTPAAARVIMLPLRALLSLLSSWTTPQVLDRHGWRYNRRATAQ